MPRRVVQVLKDSKVKRLVQAEVTDSYGRRVPTTTTVTVSSYPFTVLEETPGEEPLTILEKQKLKSNGPRMRFAAMFGYWPRPADLRRAIEKGLIKVQDEETISSVSSQMIEEPEENQED